MASLHPLNTLTDGTTYYGSGSNTLIDYIIGNDITRDMHLQTQVLKVPEIQTNHSLLKITSQTATTMRYSAKRSTRNKTIRSTKLYRTRDKEIWQRALTDILLQQQEATKHNPDICDWQKYIQQSGEKFMSKGKG